MSLSFHGMWGLKEVTIHCSGPIVTLITSGQSEGIAMNLGVRELKIQTSGKNTHRIQVDHPLLQGNSLIVTDDGFVKYLKVQKHPSIAAIEKNATARRRSYIFKRWLPLLSIAFFLLGLPALVFLTPTRWINTIVSYESEKSIREKILSSMKFKGENGKVDHLLTELVRKLKAVDPELKRWEIEVNVVENTEVNAYALPGGLIIVNQGLLNNADTLEEVIGVLGHELGHVVLRHTTKAFLNGLGTSAGYVLLSMTFGLDTSQTLMSGIGLLRLGFSREQELEADAFAAQILNKNGISIEHFVNFFEKLKSSNLGINEKAFSMLSTHPASEERISRLTELQNNSVTVKSSWKPEVNLSELKTSIKQ